MTELTIIEAISNVGFPIVAFLLMYWQGNNTIRQNTKVMKELIEEIRRGR